MSAQPPMISVADYAIDWLDTHCLDEPDFGVSTTLVAPFSVMADGRPWSAATDRHSCLILDRDHGHPRDVSASPAITEWCKTRPDRRVERARILEWLHEAPWVGNFCDGAAGGAPFDRRLVAKTLGLGLSLRSDIFAGIAKTERGQMLCLAGDGWRGFVMSLRPGVSVCGTDLLGDA